MSTHSDKTPEYKSQSAAHTVSQGMSNDNDEASSGFVDNRPEAFAKRNIEKEVNNSHWVKRASQLQSLADNHSIQLSPIQKRANKTGLPDNLKSGIENISGYSMDDMKVYYNSEKPAQLQTHAYAQGTDIYLGPGQEQHLLKEAWHVVQQKQVKPTMQVKGGVNVNDDTALEKEADLMGAKVNHPNYNTEGKESLIKSQSSVMSTQLMPVIQMAITGEVTVAVSSKSQAKTNTCWAASGWVIDLFKGGTYASEQAFVAAKGDATAKSNYTNNTVTDIDRIIGSSAVTNRLSGSDSSSPFLKSAISRELGSKPILANVNNNHYIIICGKRFNNQTYQLKYMDPASGSTTWADTATTGNDNKKIDSVGAYSLSVLYYIS